MKDTFNTKPVCRPLKTLKVTISMMNMDLKSIFSVFLCLALDKEPNIYQYEMRTS